MSTELSNGVIIPEEYSDDWYDEMSINLRKLNDVITAASDNATDIQRLDTDKANSSDLATVATSGDYDDLSNKPTINDSTITIQKNGSTVDSFTTNGSAKTINIPVPTKTSDLTNDSGFLTSHQSLSSCIKNNVTNNQNIKSTGITRGTAPSSAQTFGIAFSDNNNKYIGNIYGIFATDMSTSVGLYAYKGSTTANSDNIFIRVGYDASGNAYTYAPTPATTDNSTQIATTAFVKAHDSDVVHKSGNETIGGVKSFSDNISIKKIMSNVTQLQINARSSADSVAVIAGANASEGSGIWLYGKDSATGSDCRIQIYNTGKSRYERTDLVGSQFLPTPSGELDCGGTLNKWKTFNGVEPSSLSLPSGNASNVIDISSYITALDGTSNSYTVPANGWISIAITGTAIAIVSSSWSDSRLRASSGNVRMLYPVLKNETLGISVIGTTLDYARFIPCQGNV